MKWKVVVTARAFADSGGEARQELVKAGCNVLQSDSWGPLEQGHLIALCHDADAVIAATDPYDRVTFEACPQLKLVARCGVGIDSVSLTDATQAGVLITNVPDAMTDAVADYCMGLLLASVRRIHVGYQCMREGGWSEYPGIELRGKCLGLVGFGKIGQAVAQRAWGFGLRVIACDPQLNVFAMPESLREVEIKEFDEVLAESDFVSIHAPNVPSTRHLINRTTLAQMKPTAYLINTARGALIDELALLEALEKQWIAGAAIDVYEREPLPAQHPLRQAPNLLLTPHNAFNSIEAAQRMSWGCSNPILDMLHGRIPKHLCNPDALESSAIRWKTASTQTP